MYSVEYDHRYVQCVDYKQSNQNLNFEGSAILSDKEHRPIPTHNIKHANTSGTIHLFWTVMYVFTAPEVSFRVLPLTLDWIQYSHYMF